jgi:hypothetical protein
VLTDDPSRIIPVGKHGVLGRLLLSTDAEAGDTSRPQRRRVNEPRGVRAANADGASNPERVKGRATSSERCAARLGKRGESFLDD